MMRKPLLAACALCAFHAVAAAQYQVPSAYRPPPTPTPQPTTQDQGQHLRGLQRTPTRGVERVAVGSREGAGRYDARQAGTQGYDSRQAGSQSNGARQTEARPHDTRQAGSQGYGAPRSDARNVGQQNAVRPYDNRQYDSPQYDPRRRSDPRPYGPAARAAPNAGPRLRLAQNPAEARGAPPVIGRPRSGGNVMPQAPRQPFPPLNAHDQQLIDTLLKYWEYSSRDIKHYQCRFKRWRYDPVFGPSDPQAPAEFNEGTIKFEEPDKGLYQVEKSLIYQGVDDQDRPVYDDSPTPGQHWVCDGEFLYEFDYVGKRLIKRQLPPNIRGTQIARGPLPFLFRATVKQVTDRFWVRALPQRRKGEYRVEAFPKSPDDAAEFKKVEIVLSSAYLPQAVVLYSPNYSPQKPSRTTYEFEQRKKNPFQFNLFGFRQAFINVKPPDSSWEIIEQMLESSMDVNPAGGPSGVVPAAGGQRRQNPPPLQSRRSYPGPVRRR